MIEVAGLRKRFGDVKAVDGVSFRAEDGAVTGLLGPNGAGKTTTLRMLYGLIAPDDGSARVDGMEVLHDPREIRSRIGALPDAKGIYPRLTARENIRYFGELQGLSGKKLESAAQALIERLDMRDVADRRAQGFSQGERMKVAIARALIHDPPNLLLDEPTNGLDVMSTRAMRDLIRALKGQGKCILFSSHVMQEVAALCDRIVVIAHGRVVLQGTPDEVRETTGKPDLEDAFVAAIGSGQGLV